MPRRAARGTGRGQRGRPKAKTVEKGTRKPLHIQLLDVALAEFVPHIKDIASSYAKEAAKGGVSARFALEFVARYADRADANEAAELLRHLTRLTTSSEGYMPPDMEGQLAEQDRPELAALSLLESEEEGRALQSDLGAAPGVVAAPEGAARSDRARAS